MKKLLEYLSEIGRFIGLILCLAITGILAYLILRRRPGLDQRADGDIDALRDGLDGAASRSSDIADSANGVGDGLDTIATGAGKAADGTDVVRSGISKIAEANNKLRNLIDRLSATDNGIDNG